MRKLFDYFRKSSDGSATFARFATVGIIMSLLDLGLLYLLLWYGFNPYVARLISHVAAVAVGYFLNRYFSFHHVEIRRELWHSLLRHFSVHAAGGGLNYGVFSLIIYFGHRSGIEPGASSLLPLLAVWLGGVAGMCFNFFFAKRLVFDH